MASHNFLMSFHFFRTKANAELGPKKGGNQSEKDTECCFCRKMTNIFQEEASYMLVRAHITVIALRFRQ